MTPAGRAQLECDEDCRLRAYADPITHGEPWGCGYGCTGEDVGPDTVWTQARADSELTKRIQQTEAGLQHALAWFARLQASSPARADVLVNIAFNIGVRGLMRWPVTLAAVERGDWAGAAADIRGNTKWLGQVHGRALRCAAAMESGSWGGSHASAGVGRATAPANHATAASVQVDL